MNMQPANLLVAALASAAYVLLCVVIWWRARGRRRDAMHRASAPHDSGQPLLVAFASQTGTAEELATQTADALQSAGVEVQVRSFAQLDGATLRAAREALLIVSTYGEGDPPDPAARFLATVMSDESIDLSGVRFGLLALGDATYANYCGFGRQLDVWLQARGAQPLFDRIDVDNGDPQALQAWRRQLSQVAATADLPEWQGASFASWRLRSREHLNPGSEGGPVYRLELVPEDSDHCRWQSGDLLQVLVPADPARPRDYSIASIQEDGAAHLLIRLEVRADGTTGLASGWLAREVQIGGLISARTRAHANFHIGDNAARDLVLIGNGTGLAGLRAHLRQRALEQHQGGPQRRHWLIFGERHEAHDSLCATELDGWVAEGLLTRLDRVFSRDGDKVRYVQDCLRASAEQLRAWVRDGAAIYVCGSLEGMAEGVDAALRSILGESALAELQHQGRYRRDVY